MPEVVSSVSKSRQESCNNKYLRNHWCWQCIVLTIVHINLIQFLPQWQTGNNLCDIVFGSYTLQSCELLNMFLHKCQL